MNRGRSHSGQFSGGWRGGRGRGQGRRDRNEFLESSQTRADAARYPFITSAERGVFDHLHVKVGFPMEKAFKFVRTTDWGIPDGYGMFTDPSFRMPNLDRRKNDLNCTKSKLDELDISLWGRHTSFTSVTDLVVRTLRQEVHAEFCTIAWCKMYEMLETFQLVPTESSECFSSVHLCEAPGAFIAGLNHFLVTRRPNLSDWDWLANSLNPHYEGNDPNAMIDDDRFINETPTHWVFGKDNSGNIMRRGTIDMLIARVGQLRGSVKLVTADGSIDCQANPNEQEAMTSVLHFCEVVAAFAVLARGGHAVFKLFTLFEDHSAGLLFLLAAHFDELIVCKPATSKAGNSETYVVARGFRGVSDSTLEGLLSHISSEFPSGRTLFGETILPKSFKDQLFTCASLFGELQRSIIERNLSLFKNMPQEQRGRIQTMKYRVAAGFISRYSVTSLPPQKSVAERSEGGVGKRLNGSEAGLGRSYTQKRDRGGTLADRQEERLPPAKRMTVSKNDGFGADDSMAVRVMKTMGYQKGEGLGAKSQGIIDPIQASKRPQNLGLGMMTGSGGSSDLLTAGLGDGAEGLARNESVMWLQQAKSDLVPQQDWLITSEPSIEPIRLTPFCSQAIFERLISSRRNVIHDMVHTGIAKHVLPDLNGLVDFLPDVEEFSYIDASGCTDMGRFVRDGLPSVKDISGIRISSSSSSQLTPLSTDSMHDITSSSLDNITGVDAVISSLSSKVVQLVIGDALVKDSHHEAIVAPRLLAVTVCALDTLANGGNLVCRMREAHIRFTVGIINFLHHCFDSIAMVKPVQSRQALPERFIVARGFKTDSSESIKRYLRDVLNTISNSKLAVQEIMPSDKILYDTQFLQFLMNRNEALSLREAVAIEHST